MSGIPIPEARIRNFDRARTERRLRGGDRPAVTGRWQKQVSLEKDQRAKNGASSGNRTRVTSMATRYYTTKPTALLSLHAATEI